MGWMRKANTHANRESSEAPGDSTLTPAHRGGSSSAWKAVVVIILSRLGARTGL
jgi:hypothetical protein